MRIEFGLSSDRTLKVDLQCLVCPELADGSEILVRRKSAVV
jgi:hypothetical protein